MEGTPVQYVGSYIPRHDRPRLQGPRQHCKSSTDILVPLLFLILSITYLFLFQQVNNPVSTVSRSGRPIELLPSGLISLIGHNAPSLAVLMHRNVRFKKTTKRSKVSPPIAAATLAQAFKVIPLITTLYRIYSILTSSFQGTSIATGTSSVSFILQLNSIGILFIFLLMKFWLL